MLLSKRTAFLSVSTVLCVLFMIFGSFIRTNTIFFTLFASVFVMLGVFEHKISGGVLVYAASSILGFFLVSDKNVLIFFALFFGYYPILKALIERINNIVIEWILKIALGSAAFFILYFLFTNLFVAAEIKLPFVALFFASAVLFVVYDTALSLFLKFYIERIKPHIK